jgi:hypothetical protein
VSEAATTSVKAGLSQCDKKLALLLDMRLNSLIEEAEYVSKKQLLVNHKADFKASLTAFEVDQENRFELSVGG